MALLLLLASLLAAKLEELPEDTLCLTRSSGIGSRGCKLGSAVARSCSYAASCHVYFSGQAVKC